MVLWRGIVDVILIGLYFDFQSPDGSLPSSLCSPSESYGDEDLAFMTSISMEDDMDLSMRAPYISMSEADDLPLLISEDLMWGALPTTCDAPKFVQEPKMNVVVDVAAVQVVNGGNAAGQVDKTGDFLLSSNTQNEVLQQRQQQQSNSRRRKSGGHFAADEEDQMRSAKAMPLVNLLLQPVSGEAAGALNGQQLIAVVSNGSNSCSSTEDATHSDVIEPMFEEAMTKNCEWMEWRRKRKRNELTASDASLGEEGIEGWTIEEKQKTPIWL